MTFHPISRRRTSKVKDAIKLLERSSVYNDLVREKHEINKLKWLESERTGEDIGYDKALFMWARKHRMHWRAGRRKVKRKSPESEA